MAGSTPQEAVENFLQPLRRVMSCVTNSVLMVRGGYHPSAEPHAMVLAGGDATRLEGSTFAIRVVQHYRIVEDSGPRGPWKVSTAAYWYTLEQHDGPEIIAFHWHPLSRSAITHPHLHLEAGALVGNPDLAEAHIPTSRIAIEDFVRLLLRDFHVRPRRDDWEEVLDASQSAFDQWRTW